MSELRLLDANVVSSYLKQEIRESCPRFYRRIEQTIREQGLNLSVVTVYELRRGLNHLRLQGRGPSRIARTELFLQQASVFGLEAYNNRGWEVAAEIYAQGKTMSPSINLSEGDLLTAATAIAHARVLMTVDSHLDARLHELGLGASVEHCPLE